MIDYIAAFRTTLDTAEPHLRSITDSAAGTPRAPGKWSPKEIIGHLIDSASVNHERFVRATQSVDLVLPGYDQDAWVTAQAYGARNWSDLLDLWTAYNRHLVHVMSQIPAEHRHRARERHTLDVIAFREVSPDVPATLDMLMSDYVVHLEHHLAQILGHSWRPGLGAP